MERRRVRRFWTPVDHAELRELYPHIRTDAVARILGRSTCSINWQVTKLGLKKTPEYLASPDACRFRRGGEVGKAYRFRPGQPPPNNGLRRPGWFSGRMRETQFKKGSRSGASAAHHVPIGSTRLVEGYVMLKVADVPNVPYTVNWKLLHALNWERANGRPLPADHCLRFRDRNRQNCELGNLELITRRENMRRNSLHNYPKPIVRAVLARGALNRRINRMTRERGEQHA